MVRTNAIITVALFYLFIMEAQGSVKTLSASCLCDVSSSCDDKCCCDKECPSQAVSYWNTYNLCANDGFTIPFCTSFYSQPMQLYDLYQGLRLIYTVVKRLFCISRVNFIDPTAAYITTSADSQIPTLITSLSAINPNIQALSPLAAYPYLPQRNGMGLCLATSAVRNLNNLNDHCRVYVSTTTAVSTNPLLNINQFMTKNALNSSLKVYYMQSPSSTSPTIINVSSVPGCVNGATTSTCYVIKQLVLFFISSTSTTIDYTSSYVVLGLTTVNLNSPSYLHLKFSYQFIPAVGSYPYASNPGYTFGSYLTLLNSFTNTTNTYYYRIFNPINLAFRKLDGTCRSTTNNNTDNADHTNLIGLRFGINGIYTCLGTFSQMYNNLVGAFKLVAAIGSASTNLNDYIAVKFPTATVPQLNENLQLLFYYISIGSQQNPQYQIMRAELKILSISVNKQPTLFVQYQPLNNNVILNVPTPPTIDAYLPDDFLYPFYVA